MLHLKPRNNFISLSRYFKLLVATIFLGSSCKIPAPALAQIQNQCLPAGRTIANKASYSYENATSSSFAVDGDILSNQVLINATASGTIWVTARGVKDNNNKLVLGTITGELENQLVKLSFTREQAQKAILALVKAWKELPSTTTFQEVLLSGRNAIVEAVPEKVATIQTLGNSEIAQATALAKAVLQSILELVGLTEQEAALATQTASAIIQASPINEDINTVAQSALNAMISEQMAKGEMISEAGDIFTRDFNNLRLPQRSSIKAGDVLDFDFMLSNPGGTSAKVLMPNQNSGTTSEMVVPPDGRVEVTVKVKAGAVPATGSSITGEIIYQQNGNLDINVTGAGSVTGWSYQVLSPESSSELPIECPSSIETVVVLPASEGLVDPFGQVVGCAGEILPDYSGFNVGLYEPDPNDPTGGIRGVVPLTGTELPDIPGNNIPKGLEPNTENSNPYFLTNGNQGKYSFLFDKNRGQLDEGRTYILLVDPPESSIYSQRRIRFVIGEHKGDTFAYTITSLDGRPLSATDSRTSISGTLRIDDAARVGLILMLMSVNLTICQAQEIQIIKTGDRASAEPGDTVIYRLSIRNLASSTLNNVVVTDTLPLGFQFRPDSVRAQLQNNAVPVTTTQSGSTIQFNVAATLASSQILNIAYAATLTPDAVRGTGKNSAIVNAQRVDNNTNVKDGPAIHQLRVKPGILSDYGTILGRVFIDKNFDGEQQAGEHGVPNAVIFMDDGNRITTDPDGLFSVSNVIPGHRTGVLDLSSLPGLTLAPNVRFIEKNSQSRLVNLAPGGLVRMNFAVTPAAKEEAMP